MDLFAGKKLMDEGITAEGLAAISGDIMTPLSVEDQYKVSHERMLNTIIEDRSQPESRRVRAARGFVNRAEERKAKRSLVAQIRRYHRIMNGPRSAELKARALKRRKAENRYARALAALEVQDVA